MDIQLNFINHSSDVDNARIVIFQKNVAATYDEIAVAWMVIRNCGTGDNHPFVYPMGQQVAASDSYGNYTPQLDAYFGDRFEMVRDASGDVLKFAGKSASPKQIEVANALDRGAINASIYKAGKLLAQQTDIAPGQVAVFGFKPTLWIGVASQVTEGQVMNAAVMSEIDTELSLLGIASADIVMTGGGAAGFTFELENIVMA